MGKNLWYTKIPLLSIKNINKKFRHWIFVQPNQDLINVLKVWSQRMRDHFYKTLGTSKIYSPLSLPYLRNIEVAYLHSLLLYQLIFIPPPSQLILVFTFQLSLLSLFLIIRMVIFDDFNSIKNRKSKTLIKLFCFLLLFVYLWK